MDNVDNEFIKDVMESMGWSDRFVPIANDENLKLLDVIKLLGRTKLERSDTKDHVCVEVSRVREIFTNTDNEFDQNLKLLSAHKSQYTTEHHLYKLSEHENSRFKQMLKEIGKTQEELTQRGESLKNEKEKLTGAIEKLSENIEWAKTALSEWRQVISSGEETNKMIEKFCRLDAGRAEFLDSKRKLLHEAIMKKRATMVNVYEERKSLELLLERTSQLYRQAHMERRQLVNTWKDAVNQMNQREKEIKETETEIESAKRISAENVGVLAEEEIEMKIKQDQNKDTELHISELNIASSELRNRLLRLEDAVGRKSSELLALRKTVQNESQKLNNLRNQNRQMLIEEKDKEIALKACQDELELLRGRFDKFKNSNSNAQEQLRQIEELLESESKNMKVIQDETDRIGSTLFRSEQQLHKLQEAEKSLMMECSALESGITKTKASCRNLEKELLRQTEVLYNVDYNIQHAEMRIATMRGNVDEEEVKRLEDQKKYLNDVHDDKIKAENMMQTQIQRVEEDMRKLNNVYQNSIVEYERVNEKLKEKKVYVEGGEKQQKLLQQQNQEKLVEQNLLKIRISQMDKQIEKQNDKSYTLEKHKMELEAAMTDRLIDMKAQKNILKMKRKCLMEERSQMKADVGERMLKIEQLKKRHGCAVDLLGKNDDGSLVTAVQIKIQMAQEKYLLLNGGNVLNDKIMKAETEIKYMDNTLKFMNFSNHEYKKIFETVTEDSPEIIKMNDLQNQYFHSIDQIRVLKGNLVALIEHLDLLASQREQLSKEFDDVQRIKLDNNDALLKIHKELIDQETKMERADREMKMSYKGAKRRIKDLEFMCLFEKDMFVRERDERNNSALQQLADLVESIPDMAQTVTRHFLERGLSLPQTVRRTKSTCSWKSEASLGDLSNKNCVTPNKRYSHRSILSGSSTASSESSKSSSRTSVKMATSQQSGLSVVKITFPSCTTTTKIKKGCKVEKKN